MKNNIIITRKEKIKEQPKCESQVYEYRKYQIPKLRDDSEMLIAFYEIPPNKSNYPFHYHLRDEEAFYILRGEGKLVTCDSEVKVGEGDIIICPPGEAGAHMLTNTSDKENLEYIEFDVEHYPEIMKYPKSNKVGIFESKEKKEFYYMDTNVEYYDKED